MQGSTQLTANSDGYGQSPETSLYFGVLIDQLAEGTLLTRRHAAMGQNMSKQAV